MVLRVQWYDPVTSGFRGLDVDAREPRILSDFPKCRVRTATEWRVRRAIAVSLSLLLPRVLDPYNAEICSRG